jgi:hypothetical protein
MPELPEVETVRRQLEPLITGSRIVDAGAHPSARFCDAVEARGHRISRVDRRGKYLLMGLAPCDEAGDGTAETHSAERELVMHLGMTGGVHVGRTLPDDPYTRAWWSLDDDRFLVFRDIRRFGRIAVVARGEHSSLPTLHRLGPEPFDPPPSTQPWPSAGAGSRRTSYPSGRSPAWGTSTPTSRCGGPESVPPPVASVPNGPAGFSRRSVTCSPSRWPMTAPPCATTAHQQVRQGATKTTSTATGVEASHATSVAPFS